MKKKVLSAFMAMSLFMITTFTLSACGSTGAGATLKIGVLRVADSIPLYLAEKENHFKNNGVSVELIEFGSASDQSKAMEAGELDGIMTDMVVQSLINKSGGKLQVVATALGAKPEEGRFLVVSSAKGNITSPKQLEGKSVGISQGTMMEYLVDSYCEELGVNIDKVNKVQVANLSTRVDMVIKGKDIQAAILPDPLGAYALSAGAVSVIDDTTLKKNYSVSVIALDKGIIASRPNDVANFVKSIAEAMNSLNQAPSPYKAFAIEIAKVPDMLQADYAVPSFSPNTVPSAEYVEHLQKWMVKKGLLGSSMLYEDLVTAQFISG